MSWVYCRSCGLGMDEPTDRQILTHDYDCDSCNYNNSDESISDIDRVEAMGRLLDRVEALEK